MIVLCVAELLEPGIREVLDGWPITSSHPGDRDWLEWKGAELIIAQYELAYPQFHKLAKVAPLVAVVCVDSHSVEIGCLWSGASAVVHVSSYAEELLDAVGEALEGTPPTPDGPQLSKRERQVLTLLAEPSLQVKDIAGRLGIGERYINNVAHRLYDKLGVGGLGRLRCREKAVEVGRARGWLS